MNVAEVLLTINFDDSKSVVFAVSPSGVCNVAHCCTVGAPWVGIAADICRQHGLRPEGSFRTDDGGIGWLEE